MAHIHTETITITVSKLKKGVHAECNDGCELQPEIVAGLEDVVRELLGDPALIVEVKHDHE